MKNSLTADFFYGKIIRCESIEEKIKLIRILIQLGCVLRDTDLQTCNCCWNIRLRPAEDNIIESTSFQSNLHFKDIFINKSFKIYEPKWKKGWNE